MKLVLATPIDGASTQLARVTVGYVQACDALEKHLDAARLPAELLFGRDVGRARNLAVAIVLRDHPAADYVLWLDDDTWPEDIGCIERMAATGEDVIGAPYTTKRDPARWVHQLLTPCPLPEGDVQRMKFIGMGCTMTSLRCLKRMFAKGRKYTSQEHKIIVSDIFGHLFDKPRPGAPDEEDAKLSEDFSFVKRWREDHEGRAVVYLKSGRIMHAGTKAYSETDTAGRVLA
jgi:hypothetical protein